jgi:hypothetical protein
MRTEYFVGGFDAKLIVDGIGSEKYAGLLMYIVLHLSYFCALLSWVVLFPLVSEGGEDGVCD